MSRAAAARRARAGFTMVELVIGAMLMGGLLLVAGLTTDRALSLFRQRSAAEELSSAANRLLQRVSNEFAFARHSSLDPVPSVPQGSDTLTFTKCQGVAGGVVQWSAPCTLRWELDLGELDDGQDNNGDGLSDEGRLVWIQSLGLPGEQRVVFAHGLCEFMPGESFDGDDEDGDGLIDEAGLTFVLDGNVLTIQIGMQGRMPDGSVMTKVVETSVLIRN